MAGLLKIGRKGEPKSDTSADTSSIPPLAQDQLGISDDARRYLETVFKEKGAGAWVLRIAVRGGGCSGFSIHYEVTDAVSARDLRFTNDSVAIIIDPKSLNVLGGATLHVRDYLGSKSFMLVNNPNAKQCSCGQSFSL